MINLLLSISLISSLLPNPFRGEFPGYIINKDGTKKEVIFILPGSEQNGPNFYKILNSVKYIDGDNKIKLITNQCKGFAFSYNNKEYFFEATPFKELFLRTKIEGSVTLYYFLHIQCDGNHNCWPADDWILKNEYGEYLKVTFGGARRKDLAHLFRDYDSFAEKIINKEIGGADIKDTEKMVKIYNEWKLKQVKIVKEVVEKEKLDSIIQSIYKCDSDLSKTAYYDRVLGYKNLDIFISIRLKKDINSNGQYKSVGLISRNKIAQNDQDNRIGTWYYYSNQRIKEIINFNLSGQRHGVYMKYNYDGKLIKTLIYNNGVLE